MLSVPLSAARLEEEPGQRPVTMVTSRETGITCRRTLLGDKGVVTTTAKRPARPRGGLKGQSQHRSVLGASLHFCSARGASVQYHEVKINFTFEGTTIMKAAGVDTSTDVPLSATLWVDYVNEGVKQLAADRGAASRAFSRRGEIPPDAGIPRYGPRYPSGDNPRALGQSAGELHTSRYNDWRDIGVG